MSQQALYRKWRSQSFDELVGQRHVAQTLRNALESGRVAHAYIFSGPRGTGKTTSARILAKLVNCVADIAARPCNECHICRSINDGSALDLIEIDAASNTQVDKVRDAIVEKINYAPSEGKYKFYVIDECFRYEELITLADGTKLPIGKIVEEKLEVEVLSYNEQTHQIESKPVVRHMRKQPELPVVRITFDNNRALVCTINHKIYTPDGMVRAGELQVGQFVYANYETITQFQNEVVAGAAIGDGYIGLTGSYAPPSMEYKLLPEYKGLFEQPLDSGIPGGLAVSVVRKIERVPSPEFVYNIEVADNHNYFARDILVANCHMLSNSAFNALLKTIEEPPPHAMFVLATTEIHKIPATILSRCQRLDFHRITIDEMVTHLSWVVEQEGITADREVFELVARQATGSMRDALSLMDQLLAYGGEHVTLAQARGALGLAATEAIQVLIDFLIAQDVGGALQLVNRLIDQGTDPRQFLVDVLEQLRALLLTLAGGEQRLLNLPDEQMRRLRAQARHVTPPALIEVIRLFNQAGADLKLGLQPQLPLELAIIEAVLVLQRHELAPAAAPEPLPERVETPVPAARAPRSAPRKQVKERAAILEESAPLPAPPEPPLLVESLVEVEEIPEVEEDLEVELEVEELLIADEPATTAHDLAWWQQQWEGFKEFLAGRGEAGKRSALRLKFCEPHALEGQRLTLGFFYSLHLEKIQKQNERLVVEQALSAFRGAPITLQCDLVPKGAPPPAGKTKFEQAAEDPVVREASRQGGRIVDVYLPDQS
ncbi:MAG: DNA polymerase III subunit gamma/tau [Ardenticatenales bacterium]|nr:DNA polymerase III subunit gamma/tau [Ardenticatenales bacterium]